MAKYYFWVTDIWLLLRKSFFVFDSYENCSPRKKILGPLFENHKILNNIKKKVKVSYDLILNYVA